MSEYLSVLLLRPYVDSFDEGFHGKQQMRLAVLILKKAPWGGNQR